MPIPAPACRCYRQSLLFAGNPAGYIGQCFALPLINGGFLDCRAAAWVVRAGPQGVDMNQAVFDFDRFPHAQHILCSGSYLITPAAIGKYRYVIERIGAAIAG